MAIVFGFCSADFSQRDQADQRFGVASSLSLHHSNENDSSGCDDKSMGYPPHDHVDHAYQRKRPHNIRYIASDKYEQAATQVTSQSPIFMI